MVDNVTYQLNFNKALKACYDGKLPAFLPKANNKAEVVAEIERLTAKITLADEQVQRIASLPSYRWAKDGYQEILDNIAELTATLAEYQGILADPVKQRAIYKSEIMALKKLPKIVR